MSELAIWRSSRTLNESIGKTHLSGKPVHRPLAEDVDRFEQLDK
jgi:hypothetical protein